MPKVSIILPAYNEELTIKNTINEYKLIFPNDQIIVVDNNSIDSTKKEALSVLNQQIDFFLQEKNQGKGNAFRNAISRVKSDIYILVDSDSTYPAYEAKRLLEIMINERCDMVVGDRMSKDSYEKLNYKRFGHTIGNKFMSKIISILTGNKYSDVFSGMRVMSYPFVKNLDISSSGFELETELNFMASYLKAKVKEIEITYRSRPQNSFSKLNTYIDGLKIFYFAFVKLLSFKPIRPFLILSFLTFIISVYLSYRVINGYLNTGFSYSTTAIGSAIFILITFLSFFTGILLNIVTNSSRSNKVIRFLNDKRKWNLKLDLENL